MTDGPGTSEGAEPTRVDRIGAAGAVLLYTSAAAMCVWGPLLLGFTLFTDASMLVEGIIITVVCLPLGIALWCIASVEREHNRLLDTVGLPATGEITDLSTWSDGEDSGIAVALRISGPGFAAFDATWKRSPDAGLRVGLRIAVVVDPTRRLYRIETQ
ncbi:hypothetical protein ACFYXF_36805 [Streptomyces sp. NPDC002680]|uniref:hypothetical protein n=1 Tax=Streptomyces sp. NPDC002680 TaxID=3364659 RepID=UPI00369BD187